MKRFLIISAAVASLAFAAGPTPAQAADVGFSIRIGDPYRGASLRFRSEPDVILVPRSRVYYVRNYDRDLYRYGSFWYLIDDGYWYRARSYRGPFVRVGFRSVPREVYSVPTRYRRHWGTPANYGRDWNRDYRWEQDRDRNWRSRGRYGDRRDRNDRDVRDRRGRDGNRDWDWDRDRDGVRDNNRDDNRGRDFIDRNNDGVDDREQTSDRDRWRDRGDNDNDRDRDNDGVPEGGWRDR